MITVTVNGKARTISGQRVVAYADVVAMAGMNPDNLPNVAFRLDLGCGMCKVGHLTKGQTVVIMGGEVFDVQDAGTA